MPEENVFRMLEPYKDSPLFPLKRLIGRYGVAIANILSDSVKPIHICSSVEDFLEQQRRGNFECDKSWVGIEHPLSVARTEIVQGSFTNSKRSLALDLTDGHDTFILWYPHNDDAIDDFHSPIAGAREGDEVIVYAGIYVELSGLRIPQSMPYLVRNDAHHERVKNKEA